MHPSRLPLSTGVGFRPAHFADIRATRPALGFFLADVPAVAPGRPAKETRP